MIVGVHYTQSNDFSLYGRCVMGRDVAGEIAFRFLIELPQSYFNKRGE